ncbi:penicillin-binding protein [Facklamia sp. 7083-14-GEN3]|uniref:penicillin-binding protein n=1 Tax=Facklamia sp. 7083-14-GEN3 TaxID=2973478 RepID=UPI00215C23E9|nr:penicillin-binding protein [Facklamia sp. 7083-14-GEN3]MCR8968667.1 penicillin-binding protein [Facklamia sp. 7083-14-GEN3]
MTNKESKNHLPPLEGHHSKDIKPTLKQRRQRLTNQKSSNYINSEEARARRLKRINELENESLNNFDKTSSHSNKDKNPIVPIQNQSIRSEKEPTLNKNSKGLIKDSIEKNDSADKTFQNTEPLGELNLKRKSFDDSINDKDTANSSPNAMKSNRPPHQEAEETPENENDKYSSNKNFFQSYLDKRRQRKKEARSQLSLEGLDWASKVSLVISIIFNVFKRLFVYLVVVGLLFCFLFSGVGLGYFTSLVSDTTPPSKQEMAEAINQVEQQSSLYYNSGDIIADIRSDVVRSVANLEDISPYIQDGLISIEDQAFYDHIGVNPKSTLRAILQTLISGSGTGGSTLTQQLVKQQLLTNDVTFFRKANEILLALRLEKYFTKDEILNAYLNVSPFGRNNEGDNIAGIREASEGIFGKEPDEVNLPQAAFLVGLPQDPYTYTPYDFNSSLREDFEPGINRMKAVLFSMYRNKAITKEEYEAAINYDITKDFIEPENRPIERQSYLYQTVMSETIKILMEMNITDDGNQMNEVLKDIDLYNQYYSEAENQLRTGGYKVYSTIDKAIYDQLQETARENVNSLGVSYDGVYTDPSSGEEIYYVENIQTGVVVIENTSGKVLGFVAGTDYENNQIDHAFATRRSPGSTIKPLAVYAPAIENNLIAPATIIPDTPFVETYPDGTEWKPTNYGESISNKFISARESLAKSLNLPTIRIYQGLIQQNVPVYDYLNLMGFKEGLAYDEEETYNLAFSIGGVNTGPTVFEQTSAFSTFANNGYYIQGHIISKIVDSFGNTVFEQEVEPQKVFSEDTNYLMVDILRDTTEFGSGQYAKSNLQVPGDWIAKSGTSENAKDLWFIASTPSITIGTWAGYDSQYNEYFVNPNDGLGNESVRSQVYWANIANALFRVRPDIFGSNEVFAQPASVVSQNIVAITGTLPGNITYNNRIANLNGPIKQDLFKNSNPAAPLSYNFMFNASDQDTARFWTAYMRSIEETTTSTTTTEETTNEEDESSSENTDENGNLLPTDPENSETVTEEVYYE